MLTKVQKWGNSLALRIPKAFAVEALLENNSFVEISLAKGQIIVTPVPAPDWTLEELLAGITNDNLHNEIDTGFHIVDEIDELFVQALEILIVVVATPPRDSRATVAQHSPPLQIDLILCFDLVNSIGNNVNTIDLPPRMLVNSFGKLLSADCQHFHLAEDLLHELNGVAPVSLLVVL